MSSVRVFVHFHLYPVTLYMHLQVQNSNTNNCFEVQEFVVL